MDAAVKELINYGVLGVAVIALAWLVRFVWAYTQQKEKEAKEERDAARVEREAMIEAVKGNTDVLHELKRLLETTRTKR